MEGGGPRTVVERLSPLQSQHPPAAVRRSAPPRHESEPPPPQPIVSRPPALDPEAERWAARFETVPPPAEPPPAEPVAVVEEAPRKRAGRWKTQAMGSMVPLEVSSMREERAPLSEQPESSVPYAAAAPAPAAAAPAPTPPPTATTLISHDVPSGWRPNIDPQDPAIAPLRDAVLAQVSQRRLCIATTGMAGSRRAQVAAELAMGLAQVGLRVLLVEGDLENPGLNQVLAINMPPGAGFSQQLAAHRTDGSRPWTAIRCSQSLHVLAEGRMRMPGLSTSGELERALAELREQHHVLIIHAPSLQHTSELRHLRSVVHGVVLVEADQARLELGDAALRQLG
jgi:Mrp family chromosome partitioning ATPase